MLFGEPLQDHEREFVARLVDSDAVTLLIGPELRKKKGRSPSTAAAIKRDEIAEYYFYYRARHPRAKHKEEALPSVAQAFGVSTSYVDKALREAAPARCAEMKAAAAAFEESLAEFHRLLRMGATDETLAKFACAKGLLPSYETITGRARPCPPRSAKRAKLKTRAHK